MLSRPTCCKMKVFSLWYSGAEGRGLEPEGRGERPEARKLDHLLAQAEISGRYSGGGAAQAADGS